MQFTVRLAFLEPSITPDRAATSLLCPDPSSWQLSMTLVTPPDDSSPGREQRRDIRASIAPHRRPLFHLADGAYPVLDISSRGLRIRHFHPVRPAFGDQLEGTLRFIDQREPLTIQGLVTRVQTADVVIRCEEGALPLAWILEEAALATRATEAPRPE